MKKLLLLFGLVFALSGCSSAFSDFYSGLSLEELKAEPGYIPTDNVQVAKLSERPIEEVINSMYAKGYDTIGTAEWNGPADEGDSEAIAQAKKVGAALVLWRANYTDTRTAAMPIITYNPGEVSTSYHSGTVYSGGGAGTYTGTSTTYLPGTTTTNYVPFSVARYNYTALFFAKFKPGLLGVRVDDSPIEFKRKFDTSAGVLVVAVVQGWRAEKANIFPGDILVSLNGELCHYNKPFNWNIGGNNEFRIYRDGEIIAKNIYIEAP